MRRTSLAKPSKGETAPKFLRGASLRKVVFERDQGVCALCGLDTAALEAAIVAIPCHTEARGYWRSHVLRKEGWPTKGSLWLADHIVPVAEGGGDLGMDNLRTLCHKCHLKETRELRKRLSKETRRAAKLSAARVLRERE